MESHKAVGRERQFLADEGCSSRRVHCHFADVYDHVLTGRFEVRRSENRPSQVGHQRPPATGGCAAVHYLSLLLLRWLKFAWGAGMPANPLGEGVGLPSTAMLEAVFANQDFDLTPVPESRSSSPEAIWPSGAPVAPIPR